MSSELGEKMSTTFLKLSPARFVAVALTLLIGAMLTVGCSTDSQNNDDASSPFKDAVEIIEPNSEQDDNGSGAEEVVEFVEQGMPRRGGIFKYPTGNLILPDPVLAQDLKSPLFAEIYSGLMKLTDDPNERVAPDLAERFTVSNGVEYEFTLKQGLKFSDGSPATTSDVKWSWERALKPSSGSEQAREVLGLIAGATDVIEGKSEELTGIKIVDDRTMLVTITEPSAIFPMLLADPIASVLKPENVQNWGVDWSTWYRERSISEGKLEFDELPVGTGPFKLTVFDFDEGIFVMTRNEHYHDRLAYLDGVEFVTNLFVQKNGRMVSDFDTAFDQGRIDLKFGGDPRDEKNALGGDIVPLPSGKRSDFLIFNSASTPYDDILFRRALIQSADLSKHHAEEESGHAHPIPGSLIPPLLTGHDPDLSGMSYNPDQALADLEKSKYADRVEGIRPKFYSDIEGEFEMEFTFLAKTWQQTLGMEEGGYFYLNPDQYAEFMTDGKLEMTYQSVEARYPDGLDVLSRLYQPFGEGNSSNTQIEIDRMIQSATGESDIVARLEMYSDIQRAALEAAIAVPFEWPSSLGHGISLQPWVHDYAEPAYHASRFKNVWFDQTAPDRDLVTQ